MKYGILKYDIGGENLNTKEHLIFVRKDGTFQDITKDIKFCQYNSYTGKYDITFYSGQKTFSYNYYNIRWYRNPVVVPPSTVKITKGDKLLYNIKYIASFDNQYYHIIFDNGREKTYNTSVINIEKSCLVDNDTQNVFNYLKLIADEISVKTEDDYKILSNQYKEMEQYISECSAAAKYLSSTKNNQIYDNNLIIFPFGSNSSQTVAVKNAITNQISVIEGPPGTGKTQTILNIIANLLIRGKTVEVVSNNNPATENIYEKLCKYGYGFLVAPLGRKSNKKKFIASQTGEFPDISSWKISEDLLSEINSKILETSQQLNTVFDNQNKLAQAKQELSDIKTEQVYFDEQCKSNNIPNIKCKSNIKSSLLLKLWTRFEIKNNSIFQIFNTILFFFCFGIKNRNCLKFDVTTIISIIKKNYYIVRITELENQIVNLQNELNKVNAKALLDDYVKLSSRVFNNFLFRKYGNRTERKVFDIDDLWKNPKDFIKEYPIVLSTTYSSRKNLGTARERYTYDYIIMDEASQVDVATGTLALSVANNAVIVGDRQQLPNVVTELDKKKTSEIFDHFNINNSYDFAKYSFLASVCRIIPNVPNTLLREHYRCHPKIIDFCNKKFYDNQLIVMTKDSGEQDTLKVYKTVVGNHARGHISQRQIDEITQSILPNIKSKSSEIGIITPYRDQVEELRKNIDCDEILIDTVHKFQGREKDTMIMSTVDDEITSFSDDKNLLNVAVSRAVKQFFIIVNPNEKNKNTNIGDLVSYIEYNNFETIESDIYSIFDYLYKQYHSEKIKLLESSKKVSDYDSENLMYNQLEKLLTENNYTNLGIVTHLPLKEIFKNANKLNDDEYRFVVNTDSHVDFMIYNKVNKQPVLAIEVDGYDYHKEGTKQYERDTLKDGIFEKFDLPIMRFKTNGSGEKEKILSKLNEIIK